MYYEYKRRVLSTSGFEKVPLEEYVPDEGIKKHLAGIANNIWGKGNWTWKGHVKKGNWELPPPFNLYAYCFRESIIGYGEIITVQYDDEE